MARRYSIDDDPDFQNIDPQLWKVAKGREAQATSRIEHGYSREEWLSYVYYLVLIETNNQTIDEAELTSIVRRMKSSTKHLMTPPYLRDTYFNKNVSA